MSTTNWGVVEQDLILKLKADLVPGWARSVKSARSEGSADTAPKGFNSIYVVNHGSRSGDSQRSNSGYIRQDTVWTCAVLFYTQCGLQTEEATFGVKGLYSLAQAGRNVLLGYVPAGQQENGDCLRLRVDANVEEYEQQAGTVSLKLKQEYVLKHLVSAQITAAVAA